MMLAALLLSADPFLIERIDTPEGVVPEVGGIDVDAQGRVWACFHHGEVCVLEDNAWRIFATGLHDPLGLLVREDGSVVVMQRPELTELVDVDGDGQADEYNTLCDDFGLSGNYHEFNFGPVVCNQLENIFPFFLTRKTCSGQTPSRFKKQRITIEL